MSEKKIITCDGCGQIADNNSPKGWIKADITIVQGGKGVTSIDTCSWACLGRYGNKRSKEQEAAQQG